MTSSPMPVTPTDAMLGFIDRRRRLLFGILMVALLTAFNGRWRLGPDSMLYVSLGRAIAAGHGYHSLGWPRANAHFGLPLILAVDFRLFGQSIFWPVIVLTFMMGVGGLGFTYRLLLFHLPRAEAVAVTLLVGFGFTFSAYLYELLTDIPGFLGIMAALTGFEALVDRGHPSRVRSAGWLLVLIGGLWLGAVMRPVTWALVLAMAGVLIWRGLRSPGVRRLTFVALSMIGAALVLFYWIDPRPTHGGEAHEAWLRKVLIEQPLHTWEVVIHHTLPLVLGPTMVEACFSLALGQILSSMMAIVLFAAAIFAVRKQPLWLVWVIGNLFMLLIYPDPQTRYFLPILPFLALGLFRVAAAIGRWTARSVAIGGLSVCCAAWMIPNMARFGGLVYRQHFTPFIPAIDHGRYVPFLEMTEGIRWSIPADAVILSDDALIIEAFAPEMHLMMPINDVAPPDFALQFRGALGAGKLYMLESDRKSTEHVLEKRGLTTGPPLITVARPAWELPRFTERWLSQSRLPDLRPLTLRQVFQLPATGARLRPSSGR